MDTALRPHRDPGLMRLPRPKRPCGQRVPEPSITLSFPTLPSLLLDKLRDFRREGRFCDVTVCVRSAERGLDRDRGVVRATSSPAAMMFRAHRVVLAAASPYFLSHAGLQTTGSEPSPNPLTLTLTPCPAISPRVFHDILLSCYTGQLVFPESQVLSYLTAASYLHMEHVVTRCTHILHSEPRGGGASRTVGGANGTAGSRVNGIVGGASDTQPSHNPAGPEAEYFTGIPDLPDGANHHHHHQHQHHNHPHQQHHSTPALLNQPQPHQQPHLAPPPATSPSSLLSGLRRKRLSDESTEDVGAWQQNRHHHSNNDGNEDDDNSDGSINDTTVTTVSKEKKSDVATEADYCGGHDDGGGSGGTGDADNSAAPKASDDSFSLPVVAEIKCEFEEPPFLIDPSGRVPELSAASVGAGEDNDGGDGGRDDSREDDDSGNDAGAEITDGRLRHNEVQFGDVAGAGGFDECKQGDDAADMVQNGQHGAPGVCDDSMGGYGAEEVDGTMAVGGGAGVAVAMDSSMEDGGVGRLPPGFGGDFTCYLCGKVFRSKQGMRLHLEVHAGLKRHTCHVCGRSFGRKQVLAYHLTTHTGLKPFECGLCGRRFPVRATLRQHLLRHHQQPAHGHAHTG